MVRLEPSGIASMTVSTCSLKKVQSSPSGASRAAKLTQAAAKILQSRAQTEGFESPKCVEVPRTMGESSPVSAPWKVP